jgi:hypothetical protein
LFPHVGLHVDLGMAPRDSRPPDRQRARSLGSPSMNK